MRLDRRVLLAVVLLACLIAAPVPAPASPHKQPEARSSSVTATRPAIS